MALSTKFQGDMGDDLEDATMYSSMVGSLQYLIVTSPDLSFAINQVCQFLHKPKEGHLLAVRMNFRYLKGCSNLGLRISSDLEEVLQLKAYTDSDWGGTLDKRSITGSSIWYGSNLLSWSAKKQPAVSNSS